MLLDFLTDAITPMESFRDDLSQVYLFHEKNRLVAVSNHSKMMLLYRVVSNEDLTSELLAPCYLGAVPYLRGLLGSALMKGGSIEVEYSEKDGKKDCVNAMRFVSGRMDAHFECTNPEVLNQSERRTKFDKPTDSVIFSFTKDMRKEFEEVARIRTPKSDERLFNLVFDGNYIRAIFGSGKHTTSLILTDKVSGNIETKIQKLISLDRFKPMIRLVSENNGMAALQEKVFYVSFDTPMANHIIATPTIREQQNR